MEWPQPGKKKSDKRLSPFKRAKFKEAILGAATNFEPNHQIMRKQNQIVAKAKEKVCSLITPDLCKLIIYVKQIHKVINFQHSPNQGRASTPLAAKMTTKDAEEFYFCFTRYPPLVAMVFPPGWCMRGNQILVVIEAALMSPQQQVTAPSHLTGPVTIGLGIKVLHYYRVNSD